jgi:23S rRNA-/tRNA-specific pseudouridylate synthase
MRPVTGQKHQLRVHCSTELGCAIVGDGKYGAKLSSSSAAAAAAAAAAVAPLSSTIRSSWQQQRADADARNGDDDGDFTPMLLHAHSLSLPASALRHDAAADAAAGGASQRNNVVMRAAVPSWFKEACAMIGVPPDDTLVV